MDPGEKPGVWESHRAGWMLLTTFSCSDPFHTRCDLPAELRNTCLRLEKRTLKRRLAVIETADARVTNLPTSISRSCRNHHREGSPVLHSRPAPGC